MDHSTPEKKSNVEVLSIKYFYDKFKKEKRKYKPSLFCIDEKVKQKRKKEVDLSLFKKIIISYLSVYFYNVYMNSVSIYFPLGGYIKKVVYNKWSLPTKAKGKKRNGGNNSIGFFWYMRPNQRMYFMLRFIKLTGSTSRMAKLEKLFLQNHDKDKLPIFIQEFNKAKKHKTLYQCTQT